MVAKGQARKHATRPARAVFEFYGEKLIALAIESHDPNRIGAELSDLYARKSLLGFKNVVMSPHNKRTGSKPSNGRSWCLCL